MKIISGLIGLCLMGCVPTIQEVKQARVKEISFYFADREVISKIYKDMKKTNQEVVAYYDGNQNKVYCSWDKFKEFDKDGERLPNMEALGHEVYHAIKLNYHD